MEETQELVFTNGTFQYGQRELLINDFSDITDITVKELNGREYQYSETDAPYTYRYFQDNGYLNIRYNFPPISDSRKTIVVGYTVVNGLRYYPDKGVDQLFWKAIPAGNPFPTQSSTITLHAPEPATFTNYGVYGAEGQANFQPGQRDATITVKGPINPGQEVEVVAEWQHGIVAGQAQPWQAAIDQQAAQRAAEEATRRQWGPVFDLGFLSLGGLLAIGGPILLYLWWYRRGRDAPVGLVADYLPDPPSDLPGRDGGDAGRRARGPAGCHRDAARPGEARGARDRRGAKERFPGHRQQQRLHLSPQAKQRATAPVRRAVHEGVLRAEGRGPALRPEEQVLQRAADAAQRPVQGRRRRGLLQPEPGFRPLAVRLPGRCDPGGRPGRAASSCQPC